jgi:hypothetical protein
MGTEALGNPTIGAQTGNVTLGYQAQRFDDGNFTTSVGWNAGTDPVVGTPTNHVQDIYIGVEAGQVDLNLNPVPPGESFTTRIGSFFTEPGGVKSCFIGGIRSNPQVFGGTVCQVTVDTADGALGVDCVNPNNPHNAVPGAPAPHAPPFLSIPQPRSAPQAPTRPQFQAMNDRVDKLQASNDELRATVAKQQKEIEALTSGLQRVSAQLEVSKPAPQVVVENR